MYKTHTLTVGRVFLSLFVFIGFSCLFQQSLSPISYIFPVTPLCALKLDIVLTRSMMSLCLRGFPTFMAQLITRGGELLKHMGV